MLSFNDFRRLLLSTAVGVSLTAALAAPVLAQEASEPVSSGPGASDSLLGEIVVTATRQADTVSRVPLSITAVTQRALDQQGVTEVRDIARLVPSLQIDQTSTGRGVTNQFSIRGVSSSAGAAVTGVYLDDTPLTKRNQNGVQNLNGTPGPLLFDLERIEVLRGPQGTLFGGSSMGGTVRFITPQPSLTTMSGFARAQLSKVAYGDFGIEGGIAVGGPIIKDKLGFRVAIFHRNTPGYIDAVDPYTRKVFREDSNKGEAKSFRGTLLWKPTEDLGITFSTYASKESVEDDNAFTVDVPSAQSLVDSGLIPQRLVNLGWGGIRPRCTAFRPVGPGVTAAQSRSSATTPVACTTATGAPTPGVTYTYPARPWPGYDLDKYQSLRGGPTTVSPYELSVMTGALTVDYDFKFAQFKSISSYLQDQGKAFSYDTSLIAPLFSGYPYFLPDFPIWNQDPGFRPKQHRYGFTQEFRLASPADARPFSWVVGYFHQNIRARGYLPFIGDIISPTRIVLGVSEVDRYSAPLINGYYSTRDQTMKDTEDAFFGEVNWWITDQIKLTGGIRRSKVGFEYTQIFFGPINNSNDPTQVPGGITAGSVSETPTVPKVGIQWQFTSDDQIYATYSQGYRAGGVNSPLSNGQCGPALAAFGMTVADVPTTFNSDKMKNYEIGAKVRMLDNRFAMNAAVFQLDWTDLQINVGPNSLGCGQQWVQNVGAARSKGFDVEAQFRVFDGFTVSAAGMYNDAYYTQDALFPAKTGTPPVFATKGQKLGVMPWRVNVQAQYDFELMSLPAYVRGDYTYTPDYTVQEYPAANYSPDTARRVKTQVVNVRAGLTLNDFNFAFFINNLFNSDDGTLTGGRTGCVAATGAACTDFNSYNPVRTITTFRPREVGLQGTYRF